MKKAAKIALFLFLAAQGFYLFGCAPRWPKLAQRIKAKHGSFYRNIKDLTIVEDMTLADLSGEFSSKTRFYRKGNKFRLETYLCLPDIPEALRETKTAIVHDGNDTWVIAPAIGKYKISFEEELRYRAERDWWQFISPEGDIVGNENINGQECHVVDFPEEDFFQKMWIDRKTFALVKAEAAAAGGDVLVWVNSDFREDSDFLIPHHRRFSVNDRPVFASRIDLFQVNSNLDDSLFYPDETEEKGMVGLQSILREAFKFGK